MKNNLLKLLVEKNIQFRDNGEWIQICNPWVNDKKYHLGINIDRDFFNCFKTNMCGTIVEFVMQLEGVEREEAKKLLGEKSRLPKEGKTNTCDHSRDRQFPPKGFGCGIDGLPWKQARLQCMVLHTPIIA